MNFNYPAILIFGAINDGTHDMDRDCFGICISECGMPSGNLATDRINGKVIELGKSHYAWRSDP